MIMSISIHDDGNRCAVAKEHEGIAWVSIGPANGDGETVAVFISGDNNFARALVMADAINAAFNPPTIQENHNAD